MRVGVVVWRQLCLNVRNRDEATDSYIETLHYWEVQVHILHREVIAVDEVVVEKLIAEQAVRRRVAIIRAIDAREAEAPIEMIILHGIGQTLDVDDGLI